MLLLSLDAGTGMDGIDSSMVVATTACKDTAGEAPSLQKLKCMAALEAEAAKCRTGDLVAKSCICMPLQGGIGEGRV